MRTHGYLQVKKGRPCCAPYQDIYSIVNNINIVLITIYYTIKSEITEIFLAVIILMFKVPVNTGRSSKAGELLTETVQYSDRTEPYSDTHRTVQYTLGSQPSIPYNDTLQE